MTGAPWQPVLDFWFAPAADGDVDVQRWFQRDDAFDAAIDAQFHRVHEAAARGDLDGWAATPRGGLALLIVLDQFSRNLFRGSPRAFAQDAQACAVARAMIDRGDDRKLEPIERVFVYLPFEHSEESGDQELSVALFVALEQSAPPAHRARFAGFTDYARQHADIIERFGRFPHRNAVLGRSSTDAETAFLALPNSSF